jgi:hypothetical protein
VLTDTTAGAPIAGRPVWVELYDGRYPRAYGTLTDGTGAWQLVLGTEISRRTRWRAYYLGEDGVAPAATPSRMIYVIPRLYLATALPTLRGTETVTVGQRFRVYGASLPRMTGKTVSLQARTASGAWVSTGLKAVVNRRGRWSVRVVPHAAGRIHVRWHFHGTHRTRWLSANSAGHAIRVVTYPVVGFNVG